ncbi:fumarylacetoacetase [Roseibacterium sp. SDUM158017]|uniref:fumarylacetoacetase n=1 Tax=Roseicyclus salinarum TaxID=3036773 RepID=UPI0024151698|nr:fumarylacetoacetase [Roseibacterium sp. SDUM158017]MDG4649924.1 fumarylacetoacetase [Roseibacterium sp. SDUM158017]
MNAPHLDETHDPARRSWVESANAEGCDFPIQNLPYGVFSQEGGARRVGVAIGDMILDLMAAEAQGRLGGGAPLFSGGSLNALMGRPQAEWTAMRRAIAALLDARGGARDLPLVARRDVTMHLPFEVRGFTDFYASREHATNVGTMFRDPENALLPNWLHIPIGYNGRASTVVVSGTPITRPIGQLKAPADDAPHLGPSAKLDFEVELGAVVGTGTAMGRPITTAEARDAIFGYVLLNDWSARDIQVWEYQPLGPFQSKAFGTTISPWVVTRAALEPFRRPAPDRVRPLLPYLHEDTPNNLDIVIEAHLTPAGGRATRLLRTNARWLYYSAAQQLAHHALSGCAMETGDLLGSGTISGGTRDSCGSLLELTWNGRDPLDVDGGTRTFLRDGDSVTLRGWCEGAVRIGFGACEGTILPAPDAPGA